MMKVEVFKALVAGRAVLSSRDRWTKGAYARDAQGRTVSDLDPSAVCFCARGAMEKGIHLGLGGQSIKMHTRNALLDAILKITLEETSIENFNDKSSYEQVIAVFDCAIEDAGKNL